MPLISFCNRLVVTRTRRIVQLSSSRLAPLRPPPPAQALTHACAQARTKRLRRWRRIAVAGISSLEWQHGGSRVTNFEHHHLTPKGCPVARRPPDVNSLGLCRPFASRVPRSMTPLSLCLPARPRPCPPASPGPFLRAALQRATLPRSEAPSTDRSHRSTPCLRSELCSAGRH